MPDEQLSALREFRQTLHRYPEVSGHEKDTAQRIQNFLNGYKPDKMQGDVGGHGIIATYTSGKPGPHILFRGDMDALPIQEINHFEHRSEFDGVSHKCGHDGHSCILLGLACLLHENPIPKGKVSLLFQPAEENGEGAQAVLKNPEFQTLKPDFVFALHNLPGYPLHEVVWHRGSFTASVISLILRFKGKTSHAAEPEKGKNPANAIADILEICNHLSNNAPERANFNLITPIHIEMGEIAYGISAGYGELHLTIRAWDEANMRTLCDRITEHVRETEQHYDLPIEAEWTHAFKANQNNDEAVDAILKAADSLKLTEHERSIPFKWGEDFGLFTQHYKGAMFGLGSGKNCPSLHNPDYDFPNALIDTGANLFYQITTELLA
ncbi:MAG: amidohydrolase [Bacteroidetes bacterium]|nr:amidohydrolase [Bacteroidota bacterium]